MSVVRNIDNIKYFAPIAISRLYEKQQQYFNCNTGAGNNVMNFTLYKDSIFNQRRIHSEKQFSKMQKMMFAKNKDGDYTQIKSPAKQQVQAQQQQAEHKQTEHQQQELQ